MKLKQWLYGAAALAMLAACSDKDIAPGSGTENSTHNGTGFISIAIDMPTVPVSRGLNDQFDDGLETEYSVKNLGILFFTGREENATFLTGYDVTNYAFENYPPEDDQVTSIKKVTFPVSITQTPESLWALAVVNYTGIFSFEDSEGVITVKKSDGTALTTSNTIEDIMEMTMSSTSCNIGITNGIFMTNTPYTTAPGSNNDVAPSGFVHLLASVDKGKIKPTQVLAEANPAAEIFVERALAKVEVFRGENINATGIPAVTSIKWAIDNTEPRSYVLRHLNIPENDDDDTWKDATKAPYWLAYAHDATFTSTNLPTYEYRFVGNNRFNYKKTSESSLKDDLDMYRIYFGFDPQGKGIEEGSNTMISYGNNAFKDISTATQSKPQYCFENTFDVKHMDYRNTTRAILQVTFSGGDFFTRGIDRDTKYSHDDAAKTFAHFAIENSDVVAAWNNHFSTPQTITLTSLVNEHNVTDSEGKKSCTAENEWIKLTMRISAEKRLIVTDIVLYDGTVTNDDVKNNNKTKIPVSFKAGVNKADVLAAINNQVTFYAYEGGVAYYAVRIKHFGDDLTPWDEPVVEGEVIPTPDTTTSYSIGETDAADKNYLGRYGVLRNNWYQLTISKISKFGEPTVSDLKLDGTPDDKTEVKQAISCKINILSWAKRTQNVEF